LNQYGEANLLEDVEYLHFVGQSVSAIGRDIVKKGWLRASTTDQQQKSDSGSTSRPPYDRRAGTTAKTDKQPAEIRNRQQFETWLRRLRLPIMLLPDGMSARKENQSRYKGPTKQLQCTVQISFPCAPSAEDRRARRTIIHHVMWDKPLGQVVVADIAKRSSLASASEKKWLWSALIGRELNRPTDALKFEEVRHDVTLVIPLHSDRLRNESSAKFLEWWQRQARNGLVKGDGLELDEEKRAELDRVRKGEWAPIEGLADGEIDDRIRQSAVDSRQDDPALRSTVPSGLISSTVLERFGAQRLLRKCEGESTEKMEGDTTMNSGLPDRSPTNKTATTRRSLLVIEGHETIEEVLGRLDKGFAIVEYPHVEVWEKATLGRLFAQGKATRVLLANTRQTQKEEGEPCQATTMPAVEAPTTSALTGLSAYASSDEDQ
jgi:hypothetical protein